MYQYNGPFFEFALLKNISVDLILGDYVDYSVYYSIL